MHCFRKKGVQAYMWCKRFLRKRRLRLNFNLVQVLYFLNFLISKSVATENITFIDVSIVMFLLSFFLVQCFSQNSTISVHLDNKSNRPIFLLTQRGPKLKNSCERKQDNSCKEGEKKKKKMRTRQIFYLLWRCRKLSN